MSLKDHVRKDFNAQAAIEAGSFLALPRGWYSGKLKEVEVRVSKHSGNSYLNFKWVVSHGEHANRGDYDLILLQHEKEEVMEIHEARLGELLQSLGYSDVPDESELEDKLLEFRIVQEVDEEYGDANGKRNRCRAFRKFTGDATSAAPPVDDEDIPF